VFEIVRLIFHHPFFDTDRVCSSAEEVERRAPISVKFEIPYFTVSGIQVRYLKIVEKSGYQALPWVRYITQHGDDYRSAAASRIEMDAHATIVYVLLLKKEALVLMYRYNRDALILFVQTAFNERVRPSTEK
jgi:hypothetical protein